jgi:Tfp pilus assembly protein PilX
VIDYDIAAFHGRGANDQCRRVRGRRKYLAHRSYQDRARRAHQRGVVLAIVLLITAMMLATSAIWFETSIAATRAATNVRDHLQAFHAADSVLTLCERNALAAIGDAPTTPLAPGEPAQWKLETAFDAGALTPVPQWPGSSRAPQCMVEPWRLASRPDASAYLLTARGFGQSSESQVWLQMELVIEDGAIERHWRRVAARPF